MTSAFLQTELASLIQDSKRKQADVRTAAEKSLNDLKAINVTSESQVAGDLLRKPQFIDPFILACNSKHSKLAVTGAICLQRLVASKAIPRGRLSDVLDAFQEASGQGSDVQLKILQALPSLLQLYVNELHGEPLSKVLSLCGGLAAGKAGIVSSTAGATFQQLVTSVFERVVDEQDEADGHKDDLAISVSDASKVFVDMCMVVKSEKPHFLQCHDISLRLALEVVENCLSNESLRILSLPESTSVCETHLIVGITAILKKDSNFSLFSQCLRISYILATDHLNTFVTGLSDVFDTQLEYIDRGSSAGWKRVLCLEFMRDICSDFDVFRNVYARFDRSDGRRHIVQDLMGALVRIAAEDPSLIGLGRQSTIPTNANESSSGVSSSVDVQDFDAVGSVVQASSGVTGISTKWSTVASPLMEQVDRKQPPEIPDTYIYTLVLECASAFSDGLSKYVMPLSIPLRSNTKSTEADETNNESEAIGRRNSQRAQKYHKLQNPLKRQDPSNQEDIRNCAAMVEDCWPAVLATCSTFLNSALDSHFYHMLVRTVQKLAQVSGVMELLTPRDALLTTLAKVSVPVNASSLLQLLYGNKQARRNLHDVDTGDDSESVKSPVQNTPRPSADLSRPSLNIRNLLCLRALLNLGIALGSTLSGASWFIIIQTLQQVEGLMSVSPSVKSTSGAASSQASNSDGQFNLAGEISAVGTASRRMIESTRSYSEASLEVLVKSVFQLIDDLAPSYTDTSGESTEEVKQRPSLTPRTPTMHRSSRSISGVMVSSAVLYVEADFVLKKINDVARVNLYRFASMGSYRGSWELIIARLLQFMAGRDIEPGLRLQAASIIDLVSLETTRLLEKQKVNPDDLSSLQQACLQALSKQLMVLYKGQGTQQDITAAEVEMHRRLLDTLENIVSHSGDSITQGWRIVFEILQLSVEGERAAATRKANNYSSQLSGEFLLRILAPAFRTVQLIVSDFLRSIDSESLWVLVQLLPLFGLQKNDVNVSLTTATLFWNINGLILERAQSIDVTKDIALKVLDKQAEVQLVETESANLWFATMMHLSELCSDPRNEARNGAIRVLLKIFEASSDRLSPMMWNISIQKVLLSSLKLYSTSMTSGLDESFSDLLSGTTELINNYAEVIVKAPNFPETWSELVTIFRATLERKTIAGYIAVFSSARDLLPALSSVNINSISLLHQLLRLWYEHHPAELPLTDESGSKELTAHSQVLKEIDLCNSDALETFNVGESKFQSLIMISIKRSITSAIQGRYDDDVKRLSADQEAVVQNLLILRRLMSNALHQYSEFLQSLIKLALARHTHTPEIVLEKLSKDRQRPKLIAFMTKCMELLEQGISSGPSNSEWVDNLAAATTLETLAAVVSTKYSNVPVNEASPAWRKASSIAEKLVVAIALHTKSPAESNLGNLAIALPVVARAILSAPLLEKQLPIASDSTLASDELFDVACFREFHAATKILLERPSTLAEQRKTYVLELFKASLISKPWYGDFPPRIEDNPLENLHVIRAGSIRMPDFFARQIVAREAFEALLSLISKVDLDNMKQSEAQPTRILVAKIAAPYVLLRIAHSIKTFLADQRLRYLNPPPRPVQTELNNILASACKLVCLDEAFADISATSSTPQDGKGHLRILYGLILQLQKFWATLPRLQVCAWQDDEDGQDIETSLKAWGTTISQTWNLNITDDP